MREYICRCMVYMVFCVAAPSALNAPKATASSIQIDYFASGGVVLGTRSFENPQANGDEFTMLPDAELMYDFVSGPNPPGTQDFSNGQFVLSGFGYSSSPMSVILELWSVDYEMQEWQVSSISAIVDGATGDLVFNVSNITGCPGGWGCADLTQIFKIEIYPGPWSPDFFFTMENFSFQFAVIPLPGAIGMGLTGMGLMGIISIGRRRRLI